MPEYGMSRGPAIDRSKLPSAPRAARGADFDPSRVPTRPPYTAFLGNLQYDICEEDIERFFMKLKVCLVWINNFQIVLPVKTFVDCDFISNNDNWQHCRLICGVAYNCPYLGLMVLSSS